MRATTHIKQSVMLRQMDIRRKENGDRILFSMKFVTQNGELHYFPFCYVCGLPWDVKSSRMRGIQPCDRFGNAIDHVYPVGIDNITLFNNMQVML